MTKFDMKTALEFFQDTRLSDRQFSGEEVSAILKQLSVEDSEFFARKLVTSSPGDSNISTIIVSFSKYLLEFCKSDFVACESGYMLLKSLFEQLKFCKRYSVLLKISEDVAVNAASHLEKLRSAFESNGGKDNDIAGDNIHVDEGDSTNLCRISNEGTLLYINFKVVYTVRWSSTLSRGFLRCLEFCLHFGVRRY